MLYEEKTGYVAGPGAPQNPNYVLVHGGNGMNPQAVHQGNLMMLAHQQHVGMGISAV